MCPGKWKVSFSFFLTYWSHAILHTEKNATWCSDDHLGTMDARSVAIMGNNHWPLMQASKLDL